MYRVRESWTDDRLDDFRDEVNRRFDKVDHEFARLNDRFDGLYRAMLLVGGGIIAALVGVIATQV